MNDILWVEPDSIDQIPNALLIDVRDSDYGVGGRLRGSVNIPLRDITSPEALGTMCAYESIVCFCQYSEQRGPAAAKLIKQRFPDKRVFVCSGGFDAISRVLAPLVAELGAASDFT